jgi:hypothetical protein
MNTGSPAFYALKRDQVHLTLAPKLKSTQMEILKNITALLKPSGNDTKWEAPFLQIFSPYTGSKLLNESTLDTSLKDTCRLAKPSLLDFVGESNLGANVWTYPVDAGFGLDIGGLVFAFFGLSWGFQFFAGLYFEGYKSIFPESRSDARHREILMNPMKIDTIERESILRQEMCFNFIRFIEYSLSASVMIVAQALLVGIIDTHVLLCMTAMCFGCMILGIAAELNLRALNVWNHFEVYIPNTLKGVDITTLKSHFSKSLLWAARISHFVGWVLIVVPIIIMWSRYDGWKSQCQADSLRLKPAQLQPFMPNGTNATVLTSLSEALETGIKPPDWVTVSPCRTPRVYPFNCPCILSCMHADNWSVCVCDVCACVSSGR